MAEKVNIIRYQDVVKRYEPKQPKSYPLPEGSTMSFVVEGRGGSPDAPMHSHAQEEYWYIIEGKAMAQFGDEQFQVSAGDLVVIPAGLLHKVWPIENYRELAFMVQTGKPDSRTLEIESKRKR